MGSAAVAALGEGTTLFLGVLDRPTVFARQGLAVFVRAVIQNHDYLLSSPEISSSEPILNEAFELVAVVLAAGAVLLPSNSPWAVGLPAGAVLLPSNSPWAVEHTPYEPTSAAWIQART